MDANVGDLVVCVDAGGAHSLCDGQAYTVAKLHKAGLSRRGEQPYGYHLVEARPHNPFVAFCPTRFRKIDHDKREACETEFVTLLKRAKRPVSA